MDDCGGALQDTGTSTSDLQDDCFAAARDDLLVRESKLGNSAAFGLLVQRYRKLIYSVALRSTQSHEDAEDVVQQTLLNALVHIQQFEERSSFSTWLVRIAINESAMVRRRSRRAAEVSIDDVGSDGATEALPAIEDMKPGPEEECARREWQGMLWAAINELKPWMQAALRLCDIDEYSTREAALALGISVSAVKARLSRARKRLRDRFRRNRMG